jgi:hypothetical protein
MDFIRTQIKSPKIKKNSESGFKKEYLAEIKEEFKVVEPVFEWIRLEVQEDIEERKVIELCQEKENHLDENIIEFRREESKFYCIN